MSSLPSSQAWIADRRLLIYKYVRKRYRADKSHGIVVETEGGDDLMMKETGFTKMDMLELDGMNSHLDGMLASGGEDGSGGALRDQEEEARRDMARTLKELKQRHPDKDMEQLIEMANYQVTTTRSQRALLLVTSTVVLVLVSQANTSLNLK